MPKPMGPPLPYPCRSYAGTLSPQLGIQFWEAPEFLRFIVLLVWLSRSKSTKIQGILQTPVTMNTAQDNLSHKGDSALNAQVMVSSDYILMPQIPLLEILEYVL